MRLIALLSMLVSLPIFSQTGTYQPENMVRPVDKTQFGSSEDMVVAAHPSAVEVCVEILRNGYSAVDLGKIASRNGIVYREKNGDDWMEGLSCDQRRSRQVT